ncbi:type II restriction endonuclease [Bergeriella denitrificans]|uniref:Type-2 restriction enzyme n=1 Tax=Bergeriella denitrificans TaxID=494 RepID=A0A378UDC4_BERDE|nr:type II restriction endonuclease [Bergeriella denitrificans]STZ75376.1 Type-2 restriction enzyme MboI [Bergeriella denitrificans]
MNNKDFQKFIGQLAETNATLEYFVDFEKVRKNVAKIALKLNQLNYLIGQEDVKRAVEELFEENPKVFEVLDILIAVRKSKKAKTYNEQGETVLLDSYFKSPEQIFEYICGTGLLEVFQNKDVHNLVDYVFGVEVGLDVNARKNRGGDNMAIAVAKVFDAADIQYRKEVSSTVFSEMVSLGEDVKRFDFVVKGARKTYLIETNFYNSGGSKLNEVARAYSDIAPKVNQYPQYEFVWITDGQGWHSAKNKLAEAYHLIPHVYNLTTLSDFVAMLKAEGV